MSELWLSIVLILIFSVGFIGFSVIADSKKQLHNDQLNHSKLVLFLPLVFLLLTPVAYLKWGSYEKQQDWFQVKQKTNQLLTNGELAELDMTMQDLLLGMRTQAFQNPQNGRLWFELGQAYANLQMRDLALASLQRAVRISNNADWVVATAQMLTSGSNEERLQAVEMLRQVINREPEHQSGLLTLGFTYLKLEQYQEAINTWKHLAALPVISEKSRQFIEQQISDTEKLISHSK
ncbi:tetratricopeptide repeat protein [Aliikangiella sp. IMCC44359]|uniref:tetratricopeptide repeat protein n=1 Tax=Aliikangiella sp. IMCC44359 TaxID=3459125 RepID=UPI00403A9EFD